MVCREEGESEGEGGGGEDGEGFAEDVGCGFGVEEVRVELVSVGARHMRRISILRFMSIGKYANMCSR